MTDPPRTATEQFLISVAVRDAVAELTATALRGRVVYVDGTFLVGAGAADPDQSFLLGQVRAHLLQEGVRLSNRRDESEIVLEVRSGALGIDREEFLLGIPALYLPAVTDETDVPLATPELAIVKSTKQYGFAAVAYAAYWRDTGELIAASGPFVGRTRREDFWFFGVGPRTVGNIPPTEP